MGGLKFPVELSWLKLWKLVFRYDTYLNTHLYYIIILLISSV